MDIKLSQIIDEELDAVLKNIKSRKAAGFNKIFLEVWKTRKFDDILLWLSITVYKQNTVEKLAKGSILYFPKKGYLAIIKKYRGLTLTVIVAKVYNAMLLNCMQPKNWKIIGKIRMVFTEIDPQHQSFWLSINSSEEYMKNFKGNTIDSYIFLQGRWSKYY